MAQTSPVRALAFDRMMPELQGADMPLADRLAAYRDAVLSLELACAHPNNRDVNPALFRAYLAHARVILETLRGLASMTDTGASEATRDQREEIADLCDRADELVDSFAMASNAHVLLPAFEAELQGTLPWPTSRSRHRGRAARSSGICGGWPSRSRLSATT